MMGKTYDAEESLVQKNTARMISVHNPITNFRTSH